MTIVIIYIYKKLEMKFKKAKKTKKQKHDTKKSSSRF